jgi:microcystin-dependent protein
MSGYYIGEVRSFAFGFEPAGWLECNGQLLSIAEYQPLFSLIGPTYGGNGVTDFAVPDIPPLKTSVAGEGLAWRIAAEGGEFPPHSAALQSETLQVETVQT